MNLRRCTFPSMESFEDGEDEAKMAAATSGRICDLTIWKQDDESGVASAQQSPQPTGWFEGYSMPRAEVKPRADFGDQRESQP